MNQLSLDLQPEPEYRTRHLRGTSWNRRLQKWEAYTSFNQKKQHLGFFQTVEAAHEAFKAAGGDVFLKKDQALAEYAKTLEATLDPSIRVIPLTQCQVALVDAADYDWLNQWKWFAWWSPCSKSFYAARNVSLDGERKQLRMHREIMHAANDVEVDHVHHVTLDNRRSELRIADRRQNAHNTGIKASNTSGYRGVNWRADKQQWRARITIDGKRITIGYFDDPKLASDAYEAAARETRGDFYCPISLPVAGSTS